MTGRHYYTWPMMCRDEVQGLMCAGQALDPLCPHSIFLKMESERDILFFLPQPPERWVHPLPTSVCLSPGPKMIGQISAP